jgi:hypothetical protein
MSDSAVVAVVEALEAAGVEYMLVGSLSSSYYGYPRSTKDADFVVQFGSSSISDVVRRLPAFRLDPQGSFEMVSATTRYVLKYVGTSFYVELFLLGDDPHDLARFKRRREVNLFGRKVCLPTPEDVLITKLQWLLSLRRSRDREDIRNLLKAQSANLDWNYVHGWCDQHGTRELLDEIGKTIPEV